MGKKLGWLSVTQALSSLARLTLRQLRQMASDLGVTLYSRKSKEDLVSAIAEPWRQSCMLPPCPKRRPAWSSYRETHSGLTCFGKYPIAIDGKLNQKARPSFACASPM